MMERKLYIHGKKRKEAYGPKCMEKKLMVQNVCISNVAIPTCIIDEMVTLRGSIICIYT